MKYIYEDRKPKVGDVVEMQCDWSKYGQPKGTLSIVTYVNKYREIQIKDSRPDDQSFYDSSFVKTVKTKPGSEAQVGDTVITVMSNNALSTPVLGDVSIVTRAEKHALTTESFPRRFLNSSRYKVLCKEENTIEQPINIDAYKQNIEQAINTYGYKQNIKQALHSLKKIIKKPKEPKMRNIRAFTKDGKLNTKGIIHQVNKFGLDGRPFIAEIVKEEVARVKDTIGKLPLEEIYSEVALKYDLELLGLIKNIQATLACMDNEDYVSNVITETKLCINAYRYIELCLQGRDFQWISEYLTKENMAANRKIDLFLSNHLHIQLYNGTITFTIGEHLTKDVLTHYIHFTTVLPIKYDKDNDKFHL